MANEPFKPQILDLLRQAQSSQNAFFQLLPAAELAISGTPDYWSAKDHVAHMTFWRQRLALRLRAIIEKEPQPEVQDFEQMNPLIFEEQRYRFWSAILSESDQAYDDLIMLTAQLTEEELTAQGRYDWVGDGMPLYTSFMGNCYEHTQIHLAQYLLERRENAHALEIYEIWSKRVVEAPVPETLKGYTLYNLACFYATHDQLEKAKPTLQQAFTLYPALREFAQTDPDLFALHLQN
jgi:tetratricopeptide (TPR) repeat protein